MAGVVATSGSAHTVGDGIDFPSVPASGEADPGSGLYVPSPLGLAAPTLGPRLQDVCRRPGVLQRGHTGGLRTPAHRGRRPQAEGPAGVSVFQHRTRQSEDQS